jgi:S1-C subfamily serine protease
MELNSVVQFIVKTKNGRGYAGMAAGSGWFYKHGEDTVIITNAHVVNGATMVFIRLPADKNTNIRVYPAGISTDLDLAVCKMDSKALCQVTSILKDKYDVDEIPTLEMGDSDEVHPTNFKDLKAPRVITRGYPHGTEYQQFTDGRVSGIKHANEQEYIVTTATIEPGNSGGPCLLGGKVIGINSMKMTNATETNIIIPSNRVKRVLGQLLDNSANTGLIKQLIEKKNEQQEAMQKAIQIAFAKTHFKQLKEDGIEVDAIKLNNMWEQHNLGGFRKTGDRITRVSVSDWYQKHVLHKDGSYALFKEVMTHVQNDNPQEIVNMRKAGFQSFCAESKEEIAPGVPESALPPRLLHMPRLGFRTCNANPAALKHYGAESGVIVRDVVEKSMFHKLGIQKFDLITHINGLKVDNFGDVWYEKLNVSLSMKDIIHRQEFGAIVTLKVKTEAGEKELTFTYEPLADTDKPNVRVLESLTDSKSAQEVATLSNGLVVKTLRLDDAMQMGLREYMQEHKQNEYRVVVCEIITDSDAFHTMNFRVGSIIDQIDGKKVGKSWTEAVNQFEKAFAKENFYMETTTGRIMFAEGKV